MYNTLCKALIMYIILSIRFIYASLMQSTMYIINAGYKIPLEGLIYAPLTLCL